MKTQQQPSTHRFHPFWLSAAMLALAILGGLQTTAQAERVLYVQNNNQRDTVKLINILKAQGHDLTVWTTSASGNALTAVEYAAQGYELLLVDEVIGSGSVGGSFNNSPIPVINWEGFLYSGTRSSFTPDNPTGGNYGSAAEAQTANAQFGQVLSNTVVNIVDANHPLAAGLPAGTVDVFDPSAPPVGTEGNGVITFAGGPGFVSGAEVVATVDGYASGYAIFGVPAGVVNVDGTTNQARWVHLPWNDSIEDRIMIEPSFFLFEAAVAWALEKPEPTKIRNFTPEGGAFQPTNTPISFSVDKVTAAGSAVTMGDIDLTINGVSVIGDASITDGGTTWNVSYTEGLPANVAITIVASATAADGGFSARLGQLDTIDPNNFTFEAEDWNFDGGMFIDNPVLCEDLAYTFPPASANCYWNQKGLTNIDELELDGVVTQEIPTSNETYRFGDPSDFARDEWVDTYISADTLVRDQYTTAGVNEYEVRNITAGEWLNYTRTYPTGFYNLYVRVSSPGALEAQVDLVDDATTTNQNLTKLGRFVAPAGTAGYALVPMTDDAGNQPITLELTETTPVTLRVTALSGGWIPNFYMLIPTEEPPNAPPTVAITSPSGGDTLNADTQTTITVDPVDTDGSITNVQVFAGAFGDTLALIGAATSAPWEVPFTPANLGVMSFQTIQVVATDDGGLQASAEIDVRVIDPAVTIVSTAVGNGADAEMREQNNNGVTSGGNGELNTRTSGNGDRNEIIALRFDLTGYDLSQLQDVKLNIVEFRNNGGRQVAVYGVAQGTAAAEGAFTTEDWDETALATFGSMPGLLATDSDPLTQSLDTNVLSTLVASQTYTGSKADVNAFDDPALENFVKSHTGSSQITFLIAAAPTYTSTGQGRIAAKEAFDLDGDRPAGPTGDFAPFLSFTIPGATISIDTFSLAGDQLTLNWSGGTGPYTLQKKSPITGTWADEQTGIAGTSATVTIDDGEGYYRVVGQ